MSKYALEKQKNINVCKHKTKYGSKKGKLILSLYTITL